MIRLSQRSIALTVLTVLVLAGIALVYLMYVEKTANAQSGGTYALVMTFPASGVDGPENIVDTFAPCANAGNCNFSCSAAAPGNVGRTCFADVCTGGGNGSTAYYYHHEYLCTYTAPSYPPADGSCAATTCSTSTCSGPDGAGGTTSYVGTLDCTASCTRTNSCGTSNTGTIVNGGGCSVSAPPEPPGGCPAPPGPSCTDFPGHIGTYPYCFTPDPCNSAPNMCGVTSPGTRDGYDPATCSASPPAPVDQCPSDPGTQCSSSECTPPGGGGGSVTANLSASPTSIANGSSSTLTWSSTGATSCSGGGFNTGGAPNGSVSVSPSSTSNYTANCTDGTNSANGAATVTVTGPGSCPGTPSISFTAAPSRIQPGFSSTLTWTAGSNIPGTSCTVTNMNTGTILATPAVSACSIVPPPPLSVSTGPLSAQTLFRVACGSFTKDVVVNLVPVFEEF